MTKPRIIKIAIGCVLVAGLITAITLPNRTAEEPTIEISKEETTQTVVTSEKQEEATPLWTEEDIEAMVTVLAGECYEDKQDDKRLVCEVILNRVSSDGFPDTIIEVVEAPNQFDGYWCQSRPVTDSDYAVAEQALEDWYENDCQALSDWLYFEAGDNHENVFRKEFY